MYEVYYVIPASRYEYANLGRLKRNHITHDTHIVHGADIGHRTDRKRESSKSTIHIYMYHSAL